MALVDVNTEDRRLRLISTVPGTPDMIMQTAAQATRTLETHRLFALSKYTSLLAIVNHVVHQKTDRLQAQHRLGQHGGVLL